MVETRNSRGRGRATSSITTSSKKRPRSRSSSLEGKSSQYMESSFLDVHSETSHQEMIEQLPEEPQAYAVTVLPGFVDPPFHLVALRMVEEYTICALKIAQNNVVINRIDAVLEALFRQLAGGHVLEVQYELRGSNWTDFSLNDAEILEVRPERRRWVTVSTRKPEGIVKLARIMALLGMVKNLVAREMYATKREIFYEKKSLFAHNQRNTDETLSIISLLLRVPRSHLNVFATTRGLVAGPLEFSVGSVPHLDCNAGYSVCQGSKLWTLSFNGQTFQGINLPQHLGQLRFISCSAKFVLVVEKEATFQTLLGGGICQKYPCLLLTAKGYPDLISREFVWRLHDAGLPVFALTDGDPSGLEIMMVYRFGCKAPHYDNTSFAVPDLRWIGVHPSDIHHFQLPEERLHKLTRPQRKFAEDLLERPTCLPGFQQEIDFMLKLGYVAEIEAVTAHFRDAFLEQYLDVKLANNMWL